MNQALTQSKLSQIKKDSEQLSKLSKVFRSVSKLTNQLSLLTSEPSQLSWEFELSKAAARQVQNHREGREGRKERQNGSLNN